jgi:hypothetical protein
VWTGFSRLVADSCEHGYEPSGSIKDEYFDKLNSCQLLKNDILILCYLCVVLQRGIFPLRIGLPIQILYAVLISPHVLHVFPSYSPSSDHQRILLRLAYVFIHGHNIPFWCEIWGFHGGEDGVFFWVLVLCRLVCRCQRFGEHTVSIFKAWIYTWVYTAPKPRRTTSHSFMSLEMRVRHWRGNPPRQAVKWFHALQVILMLWRRNRSSWNKRKVVASSCELKVLRALNL